jgi:hypothetical protein
VSRPDEAVEVGAARPGEQLNADLERGDSGPDLPERQLVDATALDPGDIGSRDPGPVGQVLLPPATPDPAHPHDDTELDCIHWPAIVTSPAHRRAIGR